MSKRQRQIEYKAEKAAPDSQLTGGNVHHGMSMLASVYARVFSNIFPGENDEAMQRIIAKECVKFWKRFAPRDVVEELLLQQMLVQHVKVLYLTTMAPRQSMGKWEAMYLEAADRAANTFKRQMLALAEYRQPRGFTAIRQANIAQQQIISDQQVLKNEKVQNELSETAAPLLPDARGPAGAEGFGITPEVLVAQHRTANSGGEAPIEQERHHTRNVRRRKPAKSSGGNDAHGRKKS